MNGPDGLMDVKTGGCMYRKEIGPTEIGVKFAI
jgi:hypothetical protein